GSIQANSGIADASFPGQETLNGKAAIPCFWLRKASEPCARPARAARNESWIEWEQFPCRRQETPCHHQPGAIRNHPAAEKNGFAFPGLTQTAARAKILS